MKPISTTVLAAVAFVGAPLSAAIAQGQEISVADRQAMIENFFEADSNDDGMLYLSEFEMLMKLNAEDNLGRAAIVVRTGAYKRVFERLDANGDGAVSSEELQELVEGRV